MVLNLKINIPAVRLPPPIRLPPIQPIKLPEPLRVAPIKVNEIIKQIPLLSKPLVIPPIKVPVKIDINIAGLPKVNISEPVIRVPALQIPKPPPVPKPVIDMPALKQATGIIAGVISMHPIGRAAVMGITGIADAASNGKASDFINNGNKVNGTLSMVPGGLLAQQVANDASKGKSGDALNKYVPDPKKMIMNDAIAIAKTTLTDPKNVGNTVKSVAAANIVSIKNSADVKIIESTLKKLEPIVPIKPTILEIQKVIMPVIMPVTLAPPVPIRSTLIAPSIITPVIVPSISTLKTTSDPIPVSLPIAKTTIPVPVPILTGFPPLRPVPTLTGFPPLPQTQKENEKEIPNTAVLVGGAVLILGIMVALLA
jgi:hypothetical protein